MTKSNKTRLLLIAIATILLGAIIVMVTLIQIKTSEKKNTVDLVKDISNQVKNNALPIASTSTLESETVKTLEKNKQNFIEANSFDNDFDGTGQASLVKISRKLANSNQFRKYSSEFFTELQSFFTNNQNNQFAFIKYNLQNTKYTILPADIQQITSVKTQNNTHWVYIKKGNIYISEPDLINERILKIDNSSNYFNLEIVSDVITNPKKDKVFIKYRDLIRSNSRFASYNLLEIRNIDLQNNTSEFNIINLNGFVDDIYKKDTKKQDAVLSSLVTSNPFGNKNVDGEVPNDPTWDMFESNSGELYIVSKYEKSQIWSVKYNQQKNTIVTPQINVITGMIFTKQDPNDIFVSCESLTNACWAFSPSLNVLSKLEISQTGDGLLNIKQYTTKLDIADISKTEDSVYEFDLSRSRFLSVNTADNALYFYSLFNKFKIEI